MQKYCNYTSFDCPTDCGRTEIRGSDGMLKHFLTCPKIYRVNADPYAKVFFGLAALAETALSENALKTFKAQGPRGKRYFPVAGLQNYFSKGNRKFKTWTKN